MKDWLFEAFQYIKHLILGKWRHGVHSPLVYQLTSEILRKDRTFSDFIELEKIRTELLANPTAIQIEDLGAGSRFGNNRTKTVKQIARTAVAPKVQAQAIYKLIDFFEPKSIIELGTSLGLTAMYLSAASKNAIVYTIEGSPETAAFAKKLFEKNSAKNIIPVLGAFDEKLPEILDEKDTWDCIYMDGNHSYLATMRYYSMLENKLHENSIVILDDIHWSQEMQQAWIEIKNKKEVSLSLDFFHFGVLIYRKRMTKEHFLLNGLLLSL